MIYGERIRQAREIRGMTQAHLADQIGRHKSLVAQMEIGLKTVSDDVLNSIATATLFPASFFSEPPFVEFPVSGILFRARSNVSRKALVEAARNAEHVFNIGMMLAGECKTLPVLLPISRQYSAVAARQTRSAIEVRGNEPISHLTRSLEKAGVWVIALPKLEERDAFSVWAKVGDREIPVIAYCTGVPGDRLRLSMAHEVGHLVMHKSVMKSPIEMEAEAYTFGAELLLPEHAMRKEMIAPVTLTSLARLKPRWGVSIQALAKRAYELQLITERQYRYLFYQLSANGWRTREPENLDISVEKPRLLKKMAELVYGLPIDYNKMAADAHIKVGELKTILAMYADKPEVSDSRRDSNVSSKVVAFPRLETRMRR